MNQREEEPEDRSRSRAILLHQAIYTSSVDLGLVAYRNARDRHLRDIAIAGCHIRASMGPFIQNLQFYHGLERFTVERSFFASPVDTGLLLTRILSLPKIRYLRWDETTLDRNAVVAIMSSIAFDRSTLRTLGLQSASLTDQDLEVLAAGIRNNSTLVNLSLRGNDFRHAQTLGSSIQRHPSLTSLDIEDNDIDDLDLFVAYLARNKVLKRLVLGRCPHSTIYSQIEATLQCNDMLRVLQVFTVDDQRHGDSKRRIEAILAQNSGRQRTDIVRHNRRVRDIEEWRSRAISLETPGLIAEIILKVYSLETEDKIRYTTVQDRNYSSIQYSVLRETLDQWSCFSQTIE